MILALNGAALHFDEFSVADEFNAVVFEIFMSIRVFHKLVFPYSVLPSCGDTLEFIGFNGRMNKGFGYAVFRDVNPDFENGFSVFFIAFAHIVVPVGEEKIIGDNDVVFFTPVF